MVCAAVFGTHGFVPLPVCDHSQGDYFPPNTGGGVQFFGFYSNKQTNKQTNSVRTNERTPNYSSFPVRTFYIAHATLPLPHINLNQHKHLMNSKKKINK